MRYADRIKKILSPQERTIFQKLKTPEAIQSFIDPFPINFELGGETNFSPRRVLRDMTMHCFEGALFAAAAFAYHGGSPLLMDFAATDDDEDHTVALFKRDGRWGAVSKTNHAILRYRDPVYRSVRELALSYFHEYFQAKSGKKTLRAYSRPFNLTRYAPERWITSDEHLHWLMESMAESRYEAIAPARALRNTRNASPIERKMLSLTDWSAQRP